MVGSPGQMPEYLAEDMLFLERLKPHMVGIGPFIPTTPLHLQTSQQERWRKLYFFWD